MSLGAFFGRYPEDPRFGPLRGLVQLYYQEMIELHGSAYCRDLKPQDDTQKKVCNDIISSSAEIAALIIENNKAMEGSMDKAEKVDVKQETK